MKVRVHRKGSMSRHVNVNLINFLEHSYIHVIIIL